MGSTQSDRFARLALDLIALSPNGLDGNLIDTVTTGTPTTEGIRPTSPEAVPAWEDPLVGSRLLAMVQPGQMIDTARWYATTAGPADTDQAVEKANLDAAKDRHEIEGAQLTARPVFVTVWASDRAVVVRTWTQGAGIAAYAVHTAARAA